MPKSWLEHPESWLEQSRPQAVITHMSIYEGLVPLILMPSNLKREVLIFVTDQNSRPHGCSRYPFSSVWMAALEPSLLYITISDSALHCQ